MITNRLFWSASKYFLRLQNARKLICNCKRYSRYFAFSYEPIHYYLKKFPWLYPKFVVSRFSLRSRATYLAIICASCATSIGDKLSEAASQKNIREIKKLVSDGADINTRHAFGWTPLHVAAVQGSSKFVGQLLELGANPDLIDEFTNLYDTGIKCGLHPMFVWEARKRHFEELVEIISIKQSLHGSTPLHYAVLLEDDEVVECLLKHGANPFIKNVRGDTAMDYANKSSMKSILQKYADKYQELQEEKKIEERRKFPLELRLKEFIVGQEGAIANVAAAIRRRENNWYDEDHPLVLLFMGSSGIGKTELAKQVAKYLHKDIKDGFIRLDMTEFQHKHEVAKLIGSPPGYVGYDDGGLLTKKLKAFPNAVVLFDEVEKAHPDVLTVLLQLFDEGRLTDGKGETIECKNAIFIMTTNLASDEIGSHAQLLREESEKVAEQHYSSGKKAAIEKINLSKSFKDEVVYPILKRSFRRNEFLGRINEIVYFLPFSKQEIRELVQRELEHWASLAKKRHDVNISWDPDLVETICEGYDIRYGARSLKHEVEKRVISLLASAHEKKIFTKGSSIRIGVKGKKTEEGQSPLISLTVGEGRSKQSYSQ